MHLDGRIYIAGGMNSNTCCNALRTFEVYDIAGNAWAALPDLPLGLNHPGMTAVNGTVYVVGGFIQGPKASARAFAYDVAARTWRELPQMPVKAAAPGVVTYLGKVWVFGGTAQDSWKGAGGRNVQVYDPSTNAWTVVNSAMPMGKQHIGAAVLGTKVYISPGRMPREDNTCQEYDLATNTWRVMNPMPGTARTGAVNSWPMVDGRFYYIGGETSSTASKEVHEFTPDASGGTWRRMRDYPTGLHGVGPVAVGNRIFVVGGGTSLNVTGRTDRVYVTTVSDAGQEPAVIGFPSSTATIPEGGGPLTLAVTRSGTTGSAVSASWSVIGGTAQPGTDVAAVGGTVSFAAGQTTASIAIGIIDDALVEGPEGFQVALSGASSGAVIGANGQAAVTIADDDVAASAGTLSFAASSVSVGESAGTVTLTVTRTGGSAGAVSVAWSTADGVAAAGSDYAASGGELSFAAGQTSATLSVSILADAATEGSETFTVSLSAPGGGAQLGMPSTAMVTIVDDDAGGTVLAYDDFESGWGGYTSGGSNAQLLSDGHAGGTTAAAVSDDLIDRSAFWTTGSLDATGHAAITIAFRIDATSCTSIDHRLMVSFWTGTAWQQVAELRYGVDFANESPAQRSIVIDRSQVALPDALRLRFEADTGRGFRKIYLDDITITGSPAPSAGG